MTRRSTMRDRPDNLERIEVTEEMIQAGMAALKNSGIADEYLEADRLLVVEIFRAMTSVCESCP